MSEIDLAYLQTWKGRQETAEDVLNPVPLKILDATLNREDVWALGDEIGPCRHWLYFLPAVRASDTGPDGHPKRGGFSPPVSLPRRMWAGSQIDFLTPLCVGQKVSKTSEITEVTLKEGRSGPLIFVSVLHEIKAAGVLALRERQTLVYRNFPQPGEVGALPKKPPEKAEFIREIKPDAVLLFRYSALTFNSHRIHYDHKYVTEVEGYPGLIVHAPLISTLSVDFLREKYPGALIRQFSFRAVSPLFDTAPFTLCARQTDEKTVRLWAATPEGNLALEAEAWLW